VTAYVTIGVDIGQRVDPTAIAVCERKGDRYIVRHLERLDIGTAYPAGAARIGEVYHEAVGRALEALLADEARDRGSLPEWSDGPDELESRAHRNVWMLVDATGVGTPVIDLIREHGGLASARMTGCFFTSGDRCTIKPHETEGSVGKGYLVSRLQALIQTRRIALPRTAEARALADELLNYEIRVTDDANMTAGAFKTGTHDDLATALGLAVLVDPCGHRCGTLRYA